MVSVPGRDAELARLAVACGEAAAGTGRLVLLTGEAGIGKSRLARAAAEQAAALGMACAHGWCMDDPAAPALWPWWRVARDVDGLGEALASIQGVDADDGVRWRLAEAVTDALARRASDAGLAVAIEDLHWADPLTLDLLHRLLPEITSLPILLIGTARQEGLAPAPLLMVLPDLLRASNTVHLPLSGLSASAVASWLAQEPWTRDWAPHAEDLVRRTGGNPYYIRTLVSELPHPDADVCAALTGRPTWRAVLVAPYRKLPEPARHTVATAAVMGERLAPRLLADALGHPVEEVSEHLARAVLSGILHFGTTGLAFNHALVRDAIIADLGPAERARADAGAAAALERTGDPMMLGPAAIHWSRVEGPEAAARCRDLAARAAAAQPFAPVRGLELARLALESARTLNATQEELAARLLVVARFEWAAGMLVQALDSCTAGLELAEAARRPDLMADFALVPQGIGSLDIAQIAEGLCRRALAVLPPAEQSRRARLLALCAVAAAETAASSPDHTTSVSGGQTPADLAGQAVAAARACTDRQAELETVAALHFVLSYPQSIDQRTRLAARAVELGGSSSTTMGALWGYLWQADLAFQRGDLLGVQQAIADVERVADRRSSPIARWHALRLRSASGILTGHFDQARDLARQARSLADRVGDISMVGLHYAFHVQLGLLRGDPSELLPDTLEALEHAPPLPLVRASVPVSLVLRGDLAEARAEFVALRGVPRRMPLGPRWAGTVGQIGLAAVLLDDTEVATECYHLLLSTSQWCGGDGGGSPFAAGSNEYQLGRLAHTFGDNPLAAEHFRRGVAVDDRLGARPYAALGRLGGADALAGDDPEQARRLAREAADELRRLDMPGPLARASALADAADRALSRATARPGGLSEREYEVARLAGQAMTNRQIADRLFLSVRTVESHVRSTLTKLDLTNRTQLALWLRDHET